MYDEMEKRLRSLAGMIPQKHTLSSGADTVICPPEKGNWPCEDCDMRFHDRAEPPEEETCVPAEEKEENFCADCHWFEVEEQYCFRNGCHAYNESTCEHWEPMPADEPIPASGGKTVPTTYDLLYEEGGYNSNGV